MQDANIYCEVVCLISPSPFIQTIVPGMDFVGEIVEHEVAAPLPPQPMNASNLTGFPDLKIFGANRQSRFKSQQKLRPPPMPTSAPPPQDKHDSPSEDIESELRSIHTENEQRIAEMSETEITDAQQEITEMFNPRLLKGLLNRRHALNTYKANSEPKTTCCDSDANHVHAEGHNGWIGGIKTENGYSDFSQWEALDVEKALKLSDDADHPSQDTAEILEEHDSSNEKVEARGLKSTSSKHVTFETLSDSESRANQISDDDQVAPDGYQIVQDPEDDLGVHFPQPTTPDVDLDMNDPEFYTKLHEKYYPDLPKETDKLSWMTTPMPKQVETTYESISDMRFDFQGNLVPLENDGGSVERSEIPTYKGLHHHSDNPHLAGYTLPELVHLSRSFVPGQRCLSIQILGRILHKLGKHAYDFMGVPEDDTDSYGSIRSMKDAFELMMWDLINQLRIIDSITDAANEQRTKNLSVRSYAIEALWLWKQGGGRPEGDAEEEAIIKAVNGK